MTVPSFSILLSGASAMVQGLPRRALDGAPGCDFPGRAGDDGVGAPGGREGGTPAFVAEPRELEIEALARHARRDEADARPAVEPLLAVGQRRCGAGRWSQPNRGSAQMDW